MNPAMLAMKNTVFFIFFTQKYQ